MERNNQRNSPCTSIISISSESNDSVTESNDSVTDTDNTECLPGMMVVTNEGRLKGVEYENGAPNPIRSTRNIEVNENNSRPGRTSPDSTSVSCPNSRTCGSSASNLYESEANKSHQVDVEKVVINETYSISSSDDGDSIITISDEQESEVDVGVSTTDHSSQNENLSERDNVVSENVGGSSTICVSSSSEELLLVHHVSPCAPMTVPKKRRRNQIHDLNQEDNIRKKSKK